MKKKILLIVPLIILVLIIVLSTIKLYDLSYKNKLLEKERKIVSDIKSHYSEHVYTNKETKLYKKDNSEYIEAGNINTNINLSLNPSDITVDTKYFYIPELDSYIYFEDVTPGDPSIKSDRYKNYIYFNENIKTGDSTSFYDEQGNFLYTLNKSFDFKILVKDDNRYGVVFNDQLLYIDNKDVIQKYNNINTDLKGKSRIRTLTYHFLYDPNKKSCNQDICQTLSQFESHLKYIRENDYFTLKLNELEMFLDGKIQIPEKSIVLTVDDGTTFDLGAIELLEKYKVNATLFVITSWVDPNNFKSDYLDLESHSDNMHNQYECPNYGLQGGGILCLPEETVLNDLKTSQEKLNGSKYFAYPFFDFSDRAISLLKKAGFNMAFIGQYDTEGYSYPNKTDKYKVRRMTIFSSTTMNEFISYLQ